MLIKTPNLKQWLLLSCAVVLSAGASQAQTEGWFDRTLQGSGPVELDAVTDSGGIDVRAGSSGTIRIHAVLKGHNGWLSNDVEEHIRELERNPPVEQNGNRIRVGYVRDRSLLRKISIHLEIETPPDTRLRAKADSGGIRAEGLRGPADCQTDSGGIEMRNMGSDVRASADSGGIHVDGVNGALYAHADSGSIQAFDIAGSIDARVDSGGIRISQTRPAPIRAEADSGGVRVKLAPNSGYDLNLSSDSGSMNVPQITVRGSYSRHHIEGKVRGGGPPVDIHVDSGSIDVD